MCIKILYLRRRAGGTRDDVSHPGLPHTRHGGYAAPKEAIFSTWCIKFQSLGVSDHNRCCHQVTRIANHGTRGTVWARASGECTSSISSVV